MSICWIDWETRSRCDLLTRGAYNYARDPSTVPLCMAYAFDDEPVQLWMPDQLFPRRVALHSGQFRAHNAGFDRLIYEYVICNDYDVPVPDLTQWYCTAAQAAANCLPRSLDDVGRAVKSEMRKDYRGAQLIRLLSIPQADGTFNDDPTLMHEMYRYCERDVEVMRAVSKSLRQLTADELEDYHVNEEINDRGVKIDVELCRAAIQYNAAEVAEIQALVADITHGEVPTVRSPKMREWVYARIGPQAQKLMTVYEDGIAKQSIDKNVRANLLDLAEENPDEVPVEVADVIQCADDLWASSIAKFTQLANRADPEDHRLRGAFVFNGGAATGRLASYGAQLQNLGSACVDDPATVRAAMLAGEPLIPRFGTRVTDVLKGTLRAALIPEPGNVFVCADWRSIEGRVHPWLSNCPAGEKKLDVFRSGLDPYIVNASVLFSKDYAAVDAAERKVGKVQELALGFLGANGAFAKFARGMNLTDSFISRAVKTWRRINPWAMDHGQRLEAAAYRAMRNPNVEFRAGRIAYLFDGEHLWYILPSGRILRYPYAKFEDGEITFLKSAWKPAADATEWPRNTLWPGLQVENATQATANDVLRAACREIDGIVLSAHDEAVVECRGEDARAVAEYMTRVMTTSPSWATGLPLEVEVKIMARYGK